MKKKYYFAYGSNMSLKQMKERCPNSQFISVVFLKDYKFVYDGFSQKRKGAVANIVPCKSSKVWGVLYTITEDDERALDYYEGFPVNYDKKYIKVEDLKGNKYKALVYYRKPLKPGKPSAEYRSIVISSAKAHGLPSSYIKKFL